MVKLEVCCGSMEDVICAKNGNAQRVELNSALYLGGLTPSLASYTLIKNLNIDIIVMIRPRGGGFCYRESEKKVMFEDAKLFLEAGVDGLAFGFLLDDHKIDVENTKKMVDLIHQYGKEAVFHRAFDCVYDMDEAIISLIDCHVDRVLTSGGKVTAVEGMENISYLQNIYGNQIEILPGCGIRKENVKEVIDTCKVHQVHSSCKGYVEDPTTKGECVSYAYNDGIYETSYEVVEENKVKEIVEILKQYE